MKVRKTSLVMCLAVLLVVACKGSDEDDGDETGTGGSTSGGTGAGGSATGGGGTGGGSSGGRSSGGSSTGGANMAGEMNLGGAATGGDGTGGIPNDAPTGSLLGGEFVALPGAQAAGVADASGVAQLFRTPSGDTDVAIQVLGLAPSTSYGAHLHALPCAFNAGGGHYKIDPSVTDTVAENEIWPTLETDKTGTAHGRATALDHVARGDALSIVVHDGEGTKVLCADLSAAFDSVGFEGTFAAFAAATSAEDDVTGELEVDVDSSGTTISMVLSEMDPAGSYAAHVHALPCTVMNAGGHYKIDPTVEDTLAENELWPDVDVDANGDVDSSLESEHALRSDAQSIVVHKEGEKVLCADMQRTTPWPDLQTSGVAVLFDAAAEMNLEAMTAEATMIRSTSGTTNVEVTLANLPPATALGIHVHNRPCSVENGGGHYKIDDGVEEVIEENEIWLDLTIEDDGTGSRTTTVDHLARPEAQAIVIHAEGGARLACIDLE